MSASSLHLAPARSARAVRAVLVLVVLTLAAGAAVGTASAWSLVRHRSQRAAEAALAAPGDDLALGVPVRTSFGALTAHSAQVDDGLTTADLGGMSHGVSALVGQGLARVEVALTLSNTTSRPVLVAARQFRLVTRSGSSGAVHRLVPAGTTLLAGPLPAGAGVDTRVSFVVPTDGASMWLEYDDPAGAAPLRVALGSTDRISPAAGHHH